MESNASPFCRIAIFAPHDDTRARICDSLSAAGHELVTVEDSLERLVDFAPDADPELIVLAPHPERFSAGPEIAMLRVRLGNVPVVVVTHRREISAGRRLILAEAQGVVDQEVLEQALPATVQCVFSEQVCLPAWLRDAIAQPVFTHREKQVLELVLAGLTNGEIAGQLFLSESTVKSHLASSFRKLGVSSRSEVARCLSRKGLGIRPGRTAQPPQTDLALR